MDLSRIGESPGHVPGDNQRQKLNEQEQDLPTSRGNGTRDAEEDEREERDDTDAVDNHGYIRGSVQLAWVF